MQSMAQEDFNQLKLIQKAMVATDWLHPWEWQVKITLPKGVTFDYHRELFSSVGGAKAGISNFDIFAKDVSYSPVEIGTEPVKAGAITFTYPNSNEPTTVTMTMRDNRELLVYTWFKGLAALVYNEDGTFNLPIDYLLELTLINLADEEDIESWEVFPTKLGEVQRSVDTEGLQEFQITFQQFRTLGKKG